MEYYEVAANWWADKIRNIGPASFNNGDDSRNGGIAMMMATMLAIDSAPSEDAIDAFEKRLAEFIKATVEKNSSMSLSVDYYPDYNLGTIAKETGVNPSVLPWKTTMNIDSDRVDVSSGYGAPFVKIYLKK